MRLRSFMRAIGFTVAGLALLCSQPGWADEKLATGSISRPAASNPAAKGTIAVVGDSLGDELWGGLSVIKQHDRGLKFVRGAKNSIGFTAADLKQQADAAFATGPVDVLVVMVGGNDDRRSFFVDGKPKALFATPHWIELYKASVAAYMDHVCSKQVPVVWVLLPIMRTDEATAAAKLVNSIFEEEAKGRPQITFVTTWDMTTDASGAYAPIYKDLGGTPRQMRNADGMHFTDPGKEVLADRVWKRLAEVAPAFKPMDAANAVKP